jgi:hypothetical protein
LINELKPFPCFFMSLSYQKNKGEILRIEPKSCRYGTQKAVGTGVVSVVRGTWMGYNAIGSNRSWRQRRLLRVFKTTRQQHVVVIGGT